MDSDSDFEVPPKRPYVESKGLKNEKPKGKGKASAVKADCGALHALAMQYNLTQDQMTPEVSHALHLVRTGWSPVLALKGLGEADCIAFLEGLKCIHLPPYQVETLLEAFPKAADQGMCKKYPVSVARVVQGWNRRGPSIDISEIMGDLFRFGLQELLDFFPAFVQKHLEANLVSAMRCSSNWDYLASRSLIAFPAWKGRIMAEPTNAPHLLSSAIHHHSDFSTWYYPLVVKKFAAEIIREIFRGEWSDMQKIRFIGKFLDTRHGTIARVPYEELERILGRLQDPERMCEWANVVLGLEDTVDGSVRFAVKDKISVYPKEVKALLCSMVPPEGGLRLEDGMYPELPLCIAIQGFAAFDLDAAFAYFQERIMKPRVLGKGKLFSTKDVAWLTKKSPVGFRDQIKRGGRYHDLFMLAMLLRRDPVSFRFQATGFDKFDQYNGSVLLAYL